MRQLVTAPAAKAVLTLCRVVRPHRHHVLFGHGMEFIGAACAAAGAGSIAEWLLLGGAAVLLVTTLIEKTA